MFRLVLAACLLASASACSNLLVAPGASDNGDTLIAYASDDAALFGQLYHWPAAMHLANETVECFDWDSGAYLGEIPQAPETYNVVGNTNEHQLTIAETTFGGLDILSNQPGAIIDYGSLIYITLQRARNATEAVQVMGDLVKTYGYASEGESFSIGDPHELWVLEMIGKGKGELGAVWVAQRIPDNSICAHANQARIRQFDQSGTSKDVFFAPDVISFARKMKLYSGNDEDFSFSDVYDPLTVTGARFCEARVYSFFSAWMGQDFQDEYLGYVQGRNLTNRMPLYVTVPDDRKIGLRDLMHNFQNHYENTWFDMRSDFGAEPFESGYRWRPLTWTTTADNETYCNERAISTQQTGWSFVAQMRRSMPRIGSILWFGVDDTAATIWAPMYGGITQTPGAYGSGAMFGDVTKFDMTQMFWIQNMVSNWAYSNWNLMSPELKTKQTQIMDTFEKLVKNMDATIAQKWNSGDHESAIKAATDFSVTQGNWLYGQLFDFYGYLFAKYRDGQVITRSKEQEKNPKAMPDVASPGYGEVWYDEIVVKTGDHFLVDDQPPPPDASKPGGYYETPSTYQPLYEHIHSIPNDKRNNRHV